MSAGKHQTVRIHLGLALAEVVCVSAFVFEVTRALGGNALSWAYVVEWPILGAYAVYMWRKMLKEDRLGAPAPPEVEPVDDPQLRAWNDYLAQVHAPQVSESEKRAD